MGDQEYNPSHILISTEAEAKDIIAKIKKGGKFEEIAKNKSTDDGSKNKGGELGWSSARSYAQPFAEALVKLKKGEITQKPVKSSYGWHVIRSNGMRPLKIPPFKEVKQKVQQRILQQKFQAYLEELMLIRDEKPAVYEIAWMWLFNKEYSHELPLPEDVKFPKLWKFYGVEV
jgi:peptidyl-prolyl cis-trans isomerase C